MIKPNATKKQREQRQLTITKEDVVKKPEGWIAVDFDGTLAHYDGYKGPGFTGDPVPAMIDRVKQWLEAGQEVRIFTARLTPKEGAKGVVDDVATARAAIEAWSMEHFGVALVVTNVKDHDMIEIWDDKAVQVERNTGKIKVGDFIHPIQDEFVPEVVPQSPEVEAVDDLEVPMRSPGTIISVKRIVTGNIAREGLIIPKTV
jgi:hypothetical protein